MPFSRQSNRSVELVLLATIVFVATLFCTLTLNGAARGAVVLDGVAQDSGASELASPYAVAADPLGNMYVVDQFKHRNTKFNDNGVPKRTFGSYGFGDGQLNYPEGIAVGTHSSGDVLVYVADTANNRITVFDDAGRFVDTFGEFGSGDGQFDLPSGVAFIKFSFGAGGNVLVADTRNHRVAVFTDTGTFVRNFPCTTCPVGNIRPRGVAARRVGESGNLLIYAVDELTKIVQVMNHKGVWQRSIGKRGTGKGQLQEPDDVAVDEDGNVYVADTGFAGGSTERITKYGPDGKFLYSFDTSGSANFKQPHGVGLDDQGRIYVANTGDGSVFRFKEEAPKLFVGSDGSRGHWINTKGAWFYVTYNGVEQTCKASIDAEFRVPLPSGVKTFTADAGPFTINTTSDDRKMDLTTAQVGWLKQAWQNGKQASIKAIFRARCQDGKLLTKTLSFKK